MCGSATPGTGRDRTGREDSRPAPDAGPWDAHVPSCCAAGVLLQPAGRLTSGYRRRSAASAAAVAAPRHQQQTSGGGGGDASPVRWELPAAAVGALARRASSGPEPLSGRAQKTKDGRHALCVSRSFHSGRDSWASGKGRLASILSARAVGGLACAPPRVGALRGTGSAPCWWRLVHAALSGHTPTLGAD